MVVGVYGIVDALVAVHPANAQVVDIVALFWVLHMTIVPSSSTLSTLVGWSTLVRTSVTCWLHTPMHTLFSTLLRTGSWHLFVSQQHDGERSREVGGKDVTPANCWQLGGVAEEDDVSATPRAVGDVPLGKASTAELVNDYHVRFP